MADKTKKKCYELPICNKETIALSLHLLQESINDLKYYKSCTHSSQKNQNSVNTVKETSYLQNYKLNVPKQKTKESTIEPNSNSKQNESTKTKKQSFSKNINSKDGFENLNSKQRKMLTNALLNSLIEKHSQERNKNLGISNDLESYDETLKESYKSSKHKKLKSDRHLNKNLQSNSRSSQLKEIGLTVPKKNRQNVDFKMNLSGLPFISGKSTAKSYSLSANLQEVLHLMKHHNKKDFRTKPFISTCHRSCLCDKQDDNRKAADKENCFNEDCRNNKLDEKNENYQEEIDGHYYLETLVEELNNKLASLKTQRTNLELLSGYKDEIKELNIEIEMKKKQLLEIENLMDKEYFTIPSQQIEKPHKNQRDINKIAEELINDREKYTLNSSDNIRHRKKVVPTAKQKYISLLKDLQQIQSSLRNDVN